MVTGLIVVNIDSRWGDGNDAVCVVVDENAENDEWACDERWRETHKKLYYSKNKRSKKKSETIQVCVLLVEN